MNEPSKVSMLSEDDRIGSLYDSLGWNEKSFLEEDNSCLHKNSQVSSERGKIVRYEHVEVMSYPNFILNQVSAFEKCSCCFHLFCCHLCKGRWNKLEDIEEGDMLTYNAFKKKASEIYSSDDSSHENSLRFLYVQTLSSDLTPNLVNPKWRNIGFTIDDPRGDIKIGGYYSLLFINHFIISQTFQFFFLT